MIKKPAGLLITAFMTIGLTACNTNGDNAAGDNRTARLDRNNTTMNVGNGRNTGYYNNNANGYNTTGVSNRDNGFSLGNGRDDGIDHNGPLTEDYSNNDNSDSDIVRGRNVNNNRNNEAYDNDRGGNGILFGNGRDDGIDHNGPLTEDYTNNDNSDSDVVRDNHRNDNRTRYNGTNRGTNRNVTNVNNENNRRNNDNNVRKSDNENVYSRSNSSLYNVYNKHYSNRGTVNDLNQTNILFDDHNKDMIGISADSTTINSKQYPHTRAILIQEAKYKFVPFGSVQWYQYGTDQQGKQKQQQRKPRTEAPKQQAPKQQAPIAQAPTPAPRQAAPSPKPATPAPKAATPAPAPTGDASQFVQQVINLTNAERSKQGLPALKADTQLNGVAQKKSVDMQQNNYFSHTSPTYGSPFDMMRDFGVTYKSAGENIAQGQRTPQEVVTAWMNSEGHRKNILSGNFTHIGVGYEKTGNHWTQMFIGK